MTKNIKQRVHTAAEYQALGKILEDLYLSQVKNPRKLLWFSFLRGLAYGLGIFVAGTFVVGLLAWGLSLFDEVPIIGPMIRDLMNGLN